MNNNATYFAHYREYNLSLREYTKVAMKVYLQRYVDLFNNEQNIDEKFTTDDLSFIEKIRSGRNE